MLYDSFYYHGYERGINPPEQGWDEESYIDPLDDEEDDFWEDEDDIDIDDSNFEIGE